MFSKSNYLILLDFTVIKNFRNYNFFELKTTIMVLIQYLLIAK